MNGATKNDRGAKWRSLCSQRGEKRRVALLAAAQQLFMQQGYEATSLQQIVRRAGGSMSTAYRFFGNKRMLFRSVVLDMLKEAHQQLFASQWLHLPPSQALPQLAAQMLHLSVSPLIMALRRQLVAESHRQPELAMELQCYVDTEFLQPLSTYFGQYAWRGALQDLSPMLLASLFAQACFSRHGDRMLLGSSDLSPTEEELELLAQATAGLFLAALDERASA